MAFSRVRLLRGLIPFLGLSFFILSLGVLHEELREFDYHDILRYIQALPPPRLLLAGILTLLSYAVMSMYQILAFRSVSRPLKYYEILFASFVANTFGNNAGFSMLGGESVLAGLYSSWGLTAAEVPRVIILSILAFGLGLLTLGGGSFLLEPSLQSLRPLGWIFLLLVAVYLLWSVSKKPLKIRGWDFPPVSLGLAFGQIVISCLDWTLTAGVLYVLLPSGGHLSYLGFLNIFLLATLAGWVSQIPAGFGVFETVVLLSLKTSLPASAILGSLLVYRGVYDLLPLGMASALLGIHEIVQKKERVKQVALAFTQWIPRLAPHVLAFTTFVGGALLLFSGAVPSEGARLAWLKAFLPLPVIEASHFLGSLVGAGLLVLAWGLQRRLDAAYFFTVLLLSAGIPFSLLRGFEYEQALALGVMLVALVPSRRYFYRKASFLNESFTPGWTVTILLAVTSSIWLGLFSYKHVDYSDDLWWRFSFFEEAPRFLRASVGVVGLALFFSIARLFGPVRPRAAPLTRADLEKARGIVEKSSRTSARLALLGDKEFLFSETGRSFLMYGIQGKSWIALGDPVGDGEERAELAWRFRELSDRHGGWTVFSEVGSDSLPLYLDLGLTLLKIGEEGRIRLESFSLEGTGQREFRYIQRKVEKEGYAFEVIPREEVPPLLGEFRKISDAWLQEKNTREKGFSLGLFDENYLSQFPGVVVRRGERIVAFANLLLGAEQEELTIDLMRYLEQEAPRNLVMDYLFIELMLWGKGKGYRWFNLGTAPLSGLETHSLAPFWNRLGSFIFRHGEHFYNFQGLRQFKEKFKPEWRPKYLASPGGFALPRILVDLASLVSRGPKGIIAK